MIVLVLLFRWNDDLCSSASGMTRRTLHTTHNHSGFNKSKFYNGKYTHTISRGEKDTHTDTHTDGRTRGQNIGNLVLSVCARLLNVLRQENPGIYRWLLPPPLFPRDYNEVRKRKLQGKQAIE